VPIISSKGWAPILLRSHIANLCKKAEANGLRPVLFLFYDHDPAGLKITRTFRKNLEDCQKGTGWNPSNLAIERFGLNKADIERFNLTWIDNIKTSSGREANDPEYIKEYGKRKCEANALFKNDDTLKAAEEICRHAIESYYGSNALDRFRNKEEKSKEKLGLVYADSVWKNFTKAIDIILVSLASSKPKEAETPKPYVQEKEVDVYLDNRHYGTCPKCRTQFNYSDEDVGRLVKCRFCNLPMRLKNIRESPDGEIRYTKEVRQHIAQLFKEGMSTSQIAAAYKLAEKQALAIIKEVFDSEGESHE
jgi:hypothetical protein